MEYQNHFNNHRVRKMYPPIPETLEYPDYNCDLCWQYADAVVEIAKQKIKNYKKSKKIMNYFITITTDEMTPENLEKDRLKILSKIKPIKYKSYYELTKAGRPHVHMLVTVDRYLRARDIKRVTKKFVDIKRIVDKQYLTNIDNYIQKDLMNPELRAYMDKYGLENHYEVKNKIVIDNIEHASQEMVKTKIL